jgi:tRNA-specific 2-thiouridylase
MSGGIDSSVAAARLKEEGHEVTGVTMRLNDGDGLNAAAAGRAAQRLGIPHQVVDLRDVFAREVIAHFCREYGEGRTPNPCVRCNRYIKFGALLEKAREAGADYIATGHHARIEKDDNNGRYRLKKGADRQKDQSYFLYALTQEQLGQALFPVGGLTKERVREIAGELGLPAGNRPESQEICFIPGDDYPDFIKDHLPETAHPGPIIDTDGNILGEHPGIAFYTVGQRRGLGIASPEPLYVTAIDPERNAIIAGAKEKTYRRELTAHDLNWLTNRRERPFKARARIRYRNPEAAAEVTPLDNGRVHVEFARPQMAITPGQAVVFYDGDSVIGGGTISGGKGT